MLRTLVLVGKTGNGKSATGNSILGKKKFLCKASSAGVTSTSELRTTVLEDGQMLNVIDTPGLFDSSVETEFIGKEIVKCINMAKEGIHGVLVVLSVRNRFTKEEEAAISIMQTLFGNKINDYMIVVFTGGDELEENEQTLEDFLEDCPPSLKETLSLCGDRCVLFDNRTKDQNKKTHQVNELLSLVNTVLTKNNGKPYTDEIFSELKKGTKKLHEQTEEVLTLQGHTKQEISDLTKQMHKSYEEQLKRIAEMVELRLKETTIRLAQQLMEEQAARLKGEELAYAAQMKSNDEIRKLREDLEKAQKETAQMKSNDEIRNLREYLEKAQNETENLEKAQKETSQMKSNDEIRNLRAYLEKAQNETAQMKSNDEIRKLRENLEKAQKRERKLRENLEKAQMETEELRKWAESAKCAIL